MKRRGARCLPRFHSPGGACFTKPLLGRADVNRQLLFEARAGERQRRGLRQAAVVMRGDVDGVLVGLVHRQYIRVAGLPVHRQSLQRQRHDLNGQVDLLGLADPDGEIALDAARWSGSAYRCGAR